MKIATERHSFNRFFSHSSHSWRRTKIFSNFRISSWVRMWAWLPILTGLWLKIKKNKWIKKCKVWINLIRNYHSIIIFCVHILLCYKYYNAMDKIAVICLLFWILRSEASLLSLQLIWSPCISSTLELKSGWNDSLILSSPVLSILSRTVVSAGWKLANIPEYWKW